MHNTISQQNHDIVPSSSFWFCIQCQSQALASILKGAGWWGEEGIAVVILKDDPHVFLDFELKQRHVETTFPDIATKKITSIFSRRWVTLPETSSLHLKMNPWKFGDSYWKPSFLGAMLVFFPLNPGCFKSDPYAINLLWSPHWVGFHPLNNITSWWLNQPISTTGNQPFPTRRNSSQMPGRSWRKSWTSSWWIPWDPVVRCGFGEGWCQEGKLVQGWCIYIW